MTKDDKILYFSVPVAIFTPRRRCKSYMRMHIFVFAQSLGKPMTRPPPLAPDQCLFLDIDGTLVEFTDTPSQTIVDDEIKVLLTNLVQRLAGAVALVSGRQINTMDQLFAPLRLAAAGLHGVERRDAAGTLFGAKFEDPRLSRARKSLALLAATYPGTIIEDKGRNIAVHFRLAPQFGELVQRSVQAIAAPLAEDYQLQDGVMMVEIKPRGFNKGSAVASFMREVPFAGRRPVFVGDDLTDRDGFAEVETLGGMSVGVGDRVRGQYQLQDVYDVRQWLRDFVSRPQA
jgi:trehalose 6-phosphate phosphatase